MLATPLPSTALAFRLHDACYLQYTSVSQGAYPLDLWWPRASLWPRFTNTDRACPCQEGRKQGESCRKRRFANESVCDLWVTLHLVGGHAHALGCMASPCGPKAPIHVCRAGSCL